MEVVVAVGEIVAAGAVGVDTAAVVEVVEVVKVSAGAAGAAGVACDVGAAVLAVLEGTFMG